MTGIHQTLATSQSSSPFLLDIIRDLGLTSNVVLILDAADSRSYNGTSQTWTDLSGGGNDFFLGTTSGVEGIDPTFTGVAGDGKSTTYFSFDGTQYFTETATHTFADNWHKNNGACSLIAIEWTVDSATTHQFLSNANNNAIDGVNFHLGANETLIFSHALDNTTAEAVNSGIAAATVGQYNYFGTSYNEAALNVDFQQNSTTASVVATLSTATDVNAHPLRIGNTGIATNPFANTTRLPCLAAWSSAIGATALNNLYTELKSRRFTTLT